jgi:small-conductance mechanosensitive channel
MSAFDSGEIRDLVFGAVRAAVATALLVAAFALLRLGRRRLREYISRVKHPAWIPAIVVNNLSIERIQATLITIMRVASFVVACALLYVYVPFVLSQFPATRPFGESVINQIVGTVTSVFRGIIDYLPNLITLVVVVYVTYWAVRLILWFFAEVDRGSVSHASFHRSWAVPTSRIATVIVVAIAAAIALPDLPGAGSPSFQGVGVFLGLLLSLSSSGAVSNVIAGIVLIYTRSFEIGDFIRIGGDEGEVVSRSMLVTRIRTDKNSIVSVPNGQVLTTSVQNFSAHVRERQGLLLVCTTIRVGYEVPSQQVHDLMIAAARATEGVVADPAPFVLHTSLHYSSVSYQLNAYTDHPSDLRLVTSRLNQAVQERLVDAGVRGAPTGALDRPSPITGRVSWPRGRLTRRTIE